MTTIVIVSNTGTHKVAVCQQAIDGAGEATGDLHVIVELEPSTFHTQCVLHDSAQIVIRELPRE